MRFLVLSLALLAGCSRPGSEKVLTIAVNAGVEGSALKAAAHEWGELRKTRIDVVELHHVLAHVQGLVLAAPGASSWSTSTTTRSRGWKPVTHSTPWPRRHKTALPFRATRSRRASPAWRWPCP